MPELQLRGDSKGCDVPSRGRESRAAPRPPEVPCPAHSVGNARPDDYPIIRVGNARFLVKTTDQALVAELTRIAGMLEGSPRPEFTFTNRLFDYTAQGRLAPWAWQRLPSGPG